ncbi:hypothetical protein ACQP3J_30885, partial [Escherichia coli]
LSKLEKGSQKPIHTVHPPGVYQAYDVLSRNKALGYHNGQDRHGYFTCRMQTTFKFKAHHSSLEKRKPLSPAVREGPARVLEQLFLIFFVP